MKKPGESRAFSLWVSGASLFVFFVFVGFGRFVLLHSGEGIPSVIPAKASSRHSGEGRNPFCSSLLRHSRESESPANSLCDAAH
jgi:hypothetical protein